MSFPISLFLLLRPLALFFLLSSSFGGRRSGNRDPAAPLLCDASFLAVERRRQRQRQRRPSFPRRSGSPPLFLSGEGQQQEDSKSGGEELDSALTPDPECVEAGGDSSRELYESLRRRESDLSKGIGRRYVCRTQIGFLNVHSDPDGGPFDTSNVVGQLLEGQVVTSVAPTDGDRDGPWIRHDAGGWSISEYGGFTWLEALDE